MVSKNWRSFKPRWQNGHEVAHLRYFHKKTYGESALNPKPFENLLWRVSEITQDGPKFWGNEDSSLIRAFAFLDMPGDAATVSNSVKAKTDGLLRGHTESWSESLGPPQSSRSNVRTAPMVVDPSYEPSSRLAYPSWCSVIRH